MKKSEITPGLEVYGKADTRQDGRKIRGVLVDATTYAEITERYGRKAAQFVPSKTGGWVKILETVAKMPYKKESETNGNALGVQGSLYPHHPGELWQVTRVRFVRLSTLERADEYEARLARYRQREIENRREAVAEGMRRADMIARAERALKTLGIDASVSMPHGELLVSVRIGSTEKAVGVLEALARSVPTTQPED